MNNNDGSASADSDLQDHTTMETCTVKSAVYFMLLHVNKKEIFTTEEGMA